MKALIITYYWPPAGGSGVQRWLKFVKYLQGFGIEPIVYTVNKGSYLKEDKTLLNDVPKNIQVLKQPIFEPTDLLFFKKKNEQNKGVSNVSKGGFLSFIRGNFFIPDPKIFWVKPSVRFLQNYLKDNKIDVIISTGPPHSMHLIAQKLHKKNNVKWIADFRDPWANLYYNSDFNPQKFAINKNKNLEKKVLQSADCILTVSNSLKKEFEQQAKRVEVITNGFDDEILQTENMPISDKFTISYIGLLPKQSNPKMFFQVLKDICATNKNFRTDLQLQFIGDICNEVKQEIQQNSLQKNAEFMGYVPHKKAIQFQQKAQVLLLLIPNVKNAKGILTGKLFEYLTAKRPILAVGCTDGDLSEILEETATGKVFDFKNKTELKAHILELYSKFKNQNLQIKPKNIDKFHRKELTKELAKIIKSIA